MSWALFAIGCAAAPPAADVVAPPAIEQPAATASEPAPVFQPPPTVSGPPEPQAPIQSEECTKIESAPMSREGVSGRLRCGDTITAQTRGGTKKFDTKFYERNFCTPATTQHDGGDERVYLLTLPEERTRAIVYLDTPCGNLDLAALEYESDTSPTATSTISRCEMWPKKGTSREKVDLYNDHPAKWWIVVEGQGDEEGAFGLTVQCEKW